VDPWPAQVGRRAVTERRPGDRRAVMQGAVRTDVLGDHVDDVHAEAVDPAVEPPPHHRVDRLPDLGVLPVEVGLLPVEQVQVVLARGLVELPDGAGEERLPVGRLRPGGAGGQARSGRPPPVPVALRRRSRRPALHEPGVLVAGVVDNEVHHQPHPAPVQLSDQLVDLGLSAEQRVDALVVADVVAVVGLRRRIHRREPQDVDAEVGQVVQPLQHAAEIADPVAVGVLERAGIDLVDDGTGPPGRVRGIHCSGRETVVHGLDVVGGALQRQVDVGEVRALQRQVVQHPGDASGSAVVRHSRGGAAWMGPAWMRPGQPRAQEGEPWPS